MEKILLDVLSKNGLLTGFAVVALTMWVSYWLSARFTRGRLHGSAIAIMLQGRKGLKGQAAAAPATPASSATSTAPTSTPPGSRTPAAAGGRKPGRRRAG